MISASSDSYVEKITQHMKDRAINIMSTLKRNKDLTVNQRGDAIAIIDIIMKHSPDFFIQVDIIDESQEPKKYAYTSKKNNQKILVKMVDWDTKARVLSTRELQYVAEFAYGLKKIMTSMKKILQDT